jgi:hypothetical protein
MADVAHGVERVTHWLEERGVDYQLVEHARTLSAADEAQAVGVPAGHVAKTLVLHQAGSYRLVVIPASRRLDLLRVRELTGGSPCSPRHRARDGAGFPRLRGRRVAAVRPNVAGPRDRRHQAPLPRPRALRRRGPPACGLARSARAAADGRAPGGRHLRTDPRATRLALRRAGATLTAWSPARKAGLLRGRADAPARVPSPAWRRTDATITPG